MVARQEAGKFKLSLRTKENHTPEEIQSLLKAKVNPTEINVGITSLKSLRDGTVIVEVGSKKEIHTRRQNKGKVWRGAGSQSS